MILLLFRNSSSCGLFMLGAGRLSAAVGSTLVVGLDDEVADVEDASTFEFRNPALVRSCVMSGICGMFPFAGATSVFEIFFFV